MNNKIYVIAFIVGVSVGLLAFMALMLVHLKMTTARLESKVDGISATLEQWELTK